MGRKRSRRSLWVILLSVIGVALILFNNYLIESNIIKLMTSLGSVSYSFFGGILIIIAIIVGLTK
ncbi:MAG: hypothetical protein Q8N99_06350 [Nanoarchaeota archaeon]|nr:hypothetical protein [Nanoarchaeota archaeon]